MRGKKPRRLFKENRVSPEVRKMVDAMTDGAPGQRPALYEAASAFDQPEVWEIWRRAGPGQRACLVMALKAACKGLREKKLCDFCDGVASRVRHVVVPPEGDFGPIQRPGAMSAFAAFVILCDECVAIDPELWKRKFMERYAGLQQQTGIVALGPRSAVIGEPVGGTTRLAQRSALQSCERCGQSIWLDQDQLDKDGDNAENSAFICRECADQLRERGMIKNLPMSMLGPAPQSAR